MSTLPTEISSNYKQTDLGIFPIDWEIHNLPDVIWFQEGPGLRKWQFKTKGLKVINVTNLQENGFLDLDRTDRHISWEEFEKTYKHFVCDEGDLVIASSGNSYCKVSIVRACDLPLLMNTSVIRFKPLGTFSKSYMDVYLKSKYFKDQIDLMITGGAQPNFGPAHLNLVKIPAPICTQEQTAIANALSDVDALIQELEKLIAKKQAIKTATMQQLLTGRTRLPQFAHHPDGRKKGYKPSELGEIPEDWEVVALGYVVERFAGGGTPSRGRTEYWGGEIPWVTVKDFSTFSPVSAQESITKQGLNSSASNLIARGTLITSTRMALGKAVIYDVDVAINQDLKALFCKAILDTKFLYYWFEINQKRIDELGSGSTVKGLSLSDLRSIAFLLMKPEEQQAMSKILSEMDAELDALSFRLNKTRQIKQGMMQELLTGKTRLVKPAGAA